MELGVGVVACVQAFCMPGLSYFSLYLAQRDLIPSSTTAELRKRLQEVTFHSIERQRAGSLSPWLHASTVRAIPLAIQSHFSVSIFPVWALPSHNYMPWHLVLTLRILFLSFAMWQIPTCPSGSSSTVGAYCEEAG